MIYCSSFRVLREIENIRHDASLLKEQMTLVKEDIRVVKMILFLAAIPQNAGRFIHELTTNKGKQY